MDYRNMIPGMKVKTKGTVKEGYIARLCTREDETHEKYSAECVCAKEDNELEGWYTRTDQIISYELPKSFKQREIIKNTPKYCY